MDKVILTIFWATGWILLFSKYRILKAKRFNLRETRLSIIIPAMNEEKNIGKLLNSLKRQSYKPYEIIVVNDNSTDNTQSIAENYSDIKIISLKMGPPEGWVGKPWACWNGYLNVTGNLLLFLDADVELAPMALESLLAQYFPKKGLLSVWPYQKFSSYWEHYNLPFNLIALSLLSIASFSPWHQPTVLFGPLILISKDDYQKIGGHKSVRNRIVEDLELGKVCFEKKINVHSYLGAKIIKFQMYPEGFYQLWEGLTKNMALGVFRMSFINLLILLFWFIGIYASIFQIFLQSDFLTFYFLYVCQIYILLQKTGDYNLKDAIFYPLHFLFFLVLFISSIFKIFIFKSVTWKGRKINV